MKIACTGDWHLFNYSDFSRILMAEWNEDTLRFEEVTGDDVVETENCKSMNSRLFTLLNGICDLRDYCKDNNITHVLLAGDLFHKRETIEVSVYTPSFKVIKSFRDVGLQLHILSGNHDQVDSSQIPLSAIHPLSEVAHTIEKPSVFHLKDGKESVEVVGVPFSKDKEFVLDSIRHLRTSLENPKEAILLCHLGITGGVVGSGQYSMKDEYSLKELMFNKWKYLIAGHYHQPQILEYNAIYTGSPLQNNFGDERKGEGSEGYNGFFVIDTSKRWDMRFIPIIAPRFITLSSAELTKSHKELIENNYIRVKSTAKDSDKVKKVLEDTEVNTSQIRLELEKEYVVEQRSEIGVSNTFEETVGIYASEKYNGDQDLEKIKRIGLEILQQALVGGE